jgi:hypothetical protein
MGAKRKIKLPILYGNVFNITENCVLVNVSQILKNYYYHQNNPKTVACIFKKFMLWLAGKQKLVKK